MDLTVQTAVGFIQLNLLSLQFRNSRLSCRPLNSELQQLGSSLLHLSLQMLQFCRRLLDFAGVTLQLAIILS
jgi:hypothetical protein